MPLSRHVAVLSCVAVLTGGCATTSPLRQLECAAPDARLAALLSDYDALTPSTCESEEGRECGRLRSDIEQLSLTCPAHEPSLFAVAIISYEDGDSARAQQFLDRLLSRPAPRPEAAVLRARLALDDGNLPFARRLLEQQLRVSPDHPGLHELLASVYFLGKDLTAADRELNAAGRLGAPRWRVAYHLGLLSEAGGRTAEAARLFEESVAGNPGWDGASSRLRALRAYETAPRP